MHSRLEWSGIDFFTIGTSLLEHSELANSTEENSISSDDDHLIEVKAALVIFFVLLFRLKELTLLQH